MTASSIDYTFDFNRPDHCIDGTVAVLNPRAELPQQAFLIFVNYTDSDSGKSIILCQDKGVWSLIVDTERGQVEFIPQRSYFTISDRKTKEFRRISFDNKKAIARLEASLRKDKHFFALQIALLEALVHVLPDMEVDCYLNFELLDDFGAPQEISFQERRRRRRIKRGHEWEVSLGWDVQDFIDCMSECEEDCSWWEIWWHAWCLGKCLVKCAIEPSSGNPT